MKNHLLEIMSLQITSSGKTNFKGWALFCILKVSSSECAVSNFLSLSHSRTSRTERGKLQERCNYISKDGLPGKWHNQ